MIDVIYPIHRLLLSEMQTNIRLIFYVVLQELLLCHYQYQRFEINFFDNLNQYFVIH